MAQIALIAGTFGLFVAGFVAWYSLWHRRLSSSFEHIPVRAGRRVHLLREGSVLDETFREPPGNA